MHDDELDEAERRALEAWATLPPPADFADRVVAARARAPAPARRRRWPLVVTGAVACAAAAALFTLTRTPSRADRGELIAASRTTRALGDRAVAVAEPSATLSWQIEDDGDAAIEQRAGEVFYRVERGGRFVVHTPVGDVHVTGTCFRIEVDPMNKPKQLLLSGAVGATLAAGIVVTVYEGHVIADARGARTELAAGQRATIGADGRAVIDDAHAPAEAAFAAVAAAATPDDKTASREQLLARTVTQRNEIAKLRGRLAELEQQGGSDSLTAGGGDGRRWAEASPDQLARWATECRLRNDEPGLDGWQPSTSLGRNERGLEPEELSAYNAALSEVQQRWRQQVRALYIEATNDVAGADVLSINAMHSEILQKSTPGEHNLVLQKLAAERAGLAQPPADLSATSPYERLMRGYLQLGDETEQALAKRLGAERAAAIRGEGWGQRSEWSGCPDPAR